MKRILIGLLVASVLSAAACSGNAPEGQAGSGMNHGKAMPMTASSASQSMTASTATFANLDPGVRTYVNDLLHHYLEIKNALAGDNASEASSAAAGMKEAIMGFDESLLSSEQQKTYDNIEEDLRDHAEHIAHSDLEHQREHFSMMSREMLDMVRAFGAGMTLYRDHCPMYKNGSEWLSEAKEIRNPYYGSQMMTCGSAQEMFQ